MRLRVWLSLSWLLVVFGSGLLQVSLRAEDHPATQFLRVPGFGLGPSSWTGTKCANPDERLPDELATELKSLFQVLAPDATVKLSGKELTAQFLCQNYHIHTHALGMGGDVSQNSRERLGPTARGFLLRIQYWEEPYSGQAGPAGSFNPNAQHGNEFKDHYWKRRSYEFTLPKDRGYLRFYYSYGTRTDPKLLSGIAEVIEKLYEFNEGDCRIFRDFSDDRDDDVLKELEAPLLDLIQKRHPAATVKFQGRQLIASHRVRDFKIHAVSPDGDIAPAPRVEVGPLEDGFLIKICGGHRTVLFEEMPAYGKMNGPYWTRVWNSIPHKIRFEVSYGPRTDKQIFRDLEQLLDRYGALAIQGQFENELKMLDRTASYRIPNSRRNTN